MCVAVVYKPPDATVTRFSDALQFLADKIQAINDDSYQFCLTGDFNMSHYDWKTGTTSPGSSANELKCFELLLQFVTDYFMNQYVTCPTRKTNTLDLFITNDDRLVTSVKALPTQRHNCLTTIW